MSLQGQTMSDEDINLLIKKYDKDGNSLFDKVAIDACMNLSRSPVMLIDYVYFMDVDINFRNKSRKSFCVKMQCFAKHSRDFKLTFSSFELYASSMYIYVYAL
jgi:hypothetical protein